jgi:histidyl-tRNA synthetase
MNLNRVRGASDLFGEDLMLFNQVVRTACHFSELYSFEEIRTPIMENSDVFHRTLGETSDIVNKETYTFLDRDKRSITLRPEFTAAIVRALISNSMTQSLPIRLFTYGALFRHERPQKCRLRQFHQINFEHIGSSDLNTDVEIISLASDILSKLGILDNTTLLINTLGTHQCRANYKNKLVEYLSQYKSDLSETSKYRLEKNPLRILDTKDEKEKEILKGAPDIYEFIEEKSKERFETILGHLDNLGIKYKKSTRLVRGLDYYSDFIFEFVTDDLGSQGTVFAGGRYNGLIEQMSGVSAPAIGFAGGIERMIELMKLNANTHQNKDKTDVYLVPIGDAAKNYALNLSKKLRDCDIKIRIDYGFNLKKSMQKANKLCVKYCIIFGEEEMKADTLVLKNMSDRTEKKLDLEQLIQHIKK